MARKASELAPEPEEQASMDMDDRPPRPAYNRDSPDDIETGAVFVRLLNPRSNPVTEEGLEAGWFYSDDFGAQETMEIEPLGYLHTRRLWFRAGDSTELLCQATAPHKNMLAGYGTPGGDCATCPEAELQRKVVGGREFVQGSECKAGMAFEVYVRDWGVIATWQVQGQQMRAAQRLAQYAKMYGWGGFVVALSSKAVKMQDGHNYVPVLRLMKDAPLECPPMLDYEPAERPALASSASPAKGPVTVEDDDMLPF